MSAKDANPLSTIHVKIVAFQGFLYFLSLHSIKGMFRFINKAKTHNSISLILSHVAYNRTVITSFSFKSWVSSILSHGLHKALSNCHVLTEKKC